MKNSMLMSYFLNITFRNGIGYILITKENYPSIELESTIYI